MKEFFNKNMYTNIGIIVLLVVFIIALLLFIPKDDIVYEGVEVVTVEQPQEVDISKQGVHENASPDESCRYSPDVDGQIEVLTRVFDKQDIRTYKENVWVPEEDIYEIFPDIGEKAKFNCLKTIERGLGPFTLKPYNDFWIDEASSCITLSSFCGLPIKIK